MVYIFRPVFNIIYIFYLQMIWADTNLIGCGYAFYYDPAKGFTKNYLCNYGPG